MASDQALASTRLPATVRDRLKEFAASRGESVQQVVARAVSRLLADEAREPPTKQTVLCRLKAMKDDLRRDGVTALWMFGSVARDGRPAWQRCRPRRGIRSREKDLVVNRWSPSAGHPECSGHAGRYRHP
jgi:hypothetical protein